MNAQPSLSSAWLRHLVARFGPPERSMSVPEGAPGDGDVRVLAFPSRGRLRLATVGLADRSRRSGLGVELLARVDGRVPEAAEYLVAAGGQLARHASDFSASMWVRCGPLVLPFEQETGKPVVWVQPGPGPLPLAGGELPVLALRARFLSVGEAGFLDEHGPDALIGLLMGAHADLTRLGRVALL